MVKDKNINRFSIHLPICFILMKIERCKNINDHFRNIILKFILLSSDVIKQIDILYPRLKQYECIFSERVLLRNSLRIHCHIVIIIVFINIFLIDLKINLTNMLNETDI